MVRGTWYVVHLYPVLYPGVPYMSCTLLFKKLAVQVKFKLPGTTYYVPGSSSSFTFHVSHL